MDETPPWVMFQERGLFGGSVSIKIPNNFQDVSEFRQVPDNQEVFVFKNSDASIIVELLETPSNTDEKALRINFHWQVLSHENESIYTKIESTGSLDLDINDGRLENRFDSKSFSDSVTNSYIIGSQTIPKFGKLKDTSKVCIRLLLIRIPSISSDILISFSNNESDFTFTDESFFETCKSFNIKDWSLFK